MRNLMADQLMALIDAGTGRSDVDRAQLMLAWGYPDRDWSHLANLAVGARDHLLFKMRQELFGNSAKLSCRCPKCDANYEFDIEIDEILSVDSKDASRHNEIEVAKGGQTIVFRPVSARDLAALPAGLDVQKAMRFLAQCTILSVQPESETSVSGAEHLDPELVDIIAESLGEFDPLSVAAFGLTCSDCQQEWRAFFDPVQLLWRELEAENAATLDEVHLLATHYGWREADIVAIPQARRKAYAGKLMSQSHD